MEITEVINFEQLESFLFFKNTLSCFENCLIQEVAHQFCDPELFFLAKDRKLPYDIDWFMKQYASEIYRRYSSHQCPRLAFFSEQGTIYVQGYKSFFSDMSFLDFYSKFPEERIGVSEKFVSFSEAFSTPCDYETIYEDSQVKIIVFFTHLIRVSVKKRKNDIAEKFYLEQNGYYVNPAFPSLILPYDEPYHYSYFVETFDEMRKKFGEDGVKREYLLYQEQRAHLLGKLERMKRQDEKLLRVKR